jgi:hypothetical protein
MSMCLAAYSCTLYLAGSRNLELLGVLGVVALCHSDGH